MKKNRLKEYRKKIDEFDKKIARNILKRSEIVKKIGKYKEKNSIKVKDEKREKEIIKNILKFTKTKNDKDLLKQIYNIIFIHSKKEQKAYYKRSK